MNILFLTDRDCVPQNGGIERVVSTLSDGFSKNNITCYLLTSEKILKEDQNQFKKKYLLDRENVYGQLETIVRENDIDIIFSHYMSKYNRSFVFPSVVRLKNQMPDVSHVALYHCQPGIELLRFPLSVYIRRILHGVQIVGNLSSLAKQLFLRLAGESVFKSIVAPKCRLLYDSVDKLVLLNSAHIPLFGYLIDGVDETKCGAIGNPLAYDDVPDPGLENKTKTVLVVLRMEEETKRFSKVLKYWSQLQDLHEDWQLDVVGDGQDRIIYESMASSLNLRRVNFHGRQVPRPFYEKASIFLMTSDTEGWGMTLIEAMQLGCVPVVFDTFASASTIVNDSVDGVLVAPGDDRSYLEGVTRLMNDDDLRNRMALAAMKDCQQFSKEETVKKWINLFNDLKIGKHA